jgi:hypothetical protein
MNSRFRAAAAWQPFDLIQKHVQKGSKRENGAPEEIRTPNLLAGVRTGSRARKPLFRKDSRNTQFAVNSRVCSVFAYPLETGKHAMARKCTFFSGPLLPSIPECICKDPLGIMRTLHPNIPPCVSTRLCDLVGELARTNACALVDYFTRLCSSEDAHPLFLHIAA